MNVKIKILSGFFIIASVALLSGCGCKPQNPKQYSLNLEVWGVLDDRETLNKIFEVYKKTNPNVEKIEYKKITYDTYKKELIEAMASGQGPDIFLLHNTWLSGFSDKTVPAPGEILTEQKFRNDFVDVVADDFLVNGQIWAAPMSVNCLGLYYNKDLFNEAGITSPPKTWDEFVEDTEKLTKFDEFNAIKQSGAAIGTAYNINRSTDIFNLLMLQNGTKMFEGDRAAFDRALSVGSSYVSSGENALNFYTQFAKTGSPSYTWNSNLHYSLDAFAESTVAMMFSYPWNIETVKSKAPKLNFAIASVPQFESGVKANYANYWALAVAKNKASTVDDKVRVAEAWKLIKYLATRPEGEASYISSFGQIAQTEDPNFDPGLFYAQNNHQPSGRRDIIEKQKTDPMIGVFAVDNLIAKSWRQADPEGIEQIFAGMIDSVNRGEAKASDAIHTAATRVNALTGR
ncbi:MAG: hypothetical protein A2288_00545 [Candidatus Moranbacteria bacterium RIFOXYA12_FULL_44_15]|nr:MAG: hypothetical protein A2288_00545 [Candidatus Moranbacteria bacterium RIFOXYA12_FULL_44_15]OGI35434.1 MAG: hypothetical protein A2259_00070 [Candidatus Moranbacteria bacterium RIFOXYA2_FULL_43_15]